MKVRTNKPFTYNSFHYRGGVVADMDIDTAARLKSFGYVDFVEEPKAEEPVEPVKKIVKRADPVALVK